MAHAVHTAATISDYVRKLTNAYARKRFFMGALQSDGRLVFNRGGTDIKWPIRIKRAAFNPYGEGVTASFAQVNYNVQATLGPRGGLISEAMSDWDKEINKGPAAIINLWKGKTQQLTEDFNDHMAIKLINNDGNAASNYYVHGLESVLSAASNAGQPVGTNNDNYAGFNTARGTFGSAGDGTASTWPLGGNYNPEYDAWSPIIVDTTSTFWAATGASFANYGDQQLGFAEVACGRNGKKLDFFLLAKGLYMDYRNANRGKQRIEVSKNSKMTALGFTGMSADGIEIFQEDAVASGVGYGLCMDNLELSFWHPDMVKVDTDFDVAAIADKVLVRSMHQLKIDTPRCLAKLVALT